jgi:hypothetical protein
MLSCGLIPAISAAAALLAASSAAPGMLLRNAFPLAGFPLFATVYSLAFARHWAVRL